MFKYKRYFHSKWPILDYKFTKMKEMKRWRVMPLSEYVTAHAQSVKIIIEEKWPTESTNFVHINIDIYLYLH